MEKILIVDDNEQHCELLKDVLLSWGYDVQLSLQGMDALGKAKKNLPDLILLDVMLPGLNGFEVCRELKNYPGTRDIPVIMQTVLDETDDRIRGYKVGASLFVTKPVNYAELRHHIERLIQAKKGMESNEGRSAVVRTLIRIMEKLSPEIYGHAAQVANYCNKTANLLGMTAERKTRLDIAAWLHDFGRLADEGELAHGQAGVEMLKGLKMSEWLNDYLLYHHEYADGSAPLGKKAGDLPEDVWLLAAVNQFVHYLDQCRDQEQAFTAFQEQLSRERYPEAALNALRQVIQDEIFLNKAFPGKIPG
ncbi:MAG: response regulator [Acidaminococcales bacterium]|jgi:putative two-component system response regulator|nr:response regulator [Acidaminococcales bacterium]